MTEKAINIERESEAYLGKAKWGGIETFLRQLGPHLPWVLLIEPRHVVPGVVFPEGSELLPSGFLPKVSAHYPRHLAQPSEP